MKLPCAGLALTQWIVMVVALAAAPGRAQKGPPSRSFGPDTYRTGSFPDPFGSSTSSRTVTTLGKVKLEIPVRR